MRSRAAAHRLAVQTWGEFARLARGERVASGDYFRCPTIRRASISGDGSFKFTRMSIVSTISLAPGRVRAKSSLHPECCNTGVETSSFGEDKGTIAGSDAGRKDLK